MGHLTCRTSAIPERRTATSQEILRGKPWVCNGLSKYAFDRGLLDRGVQVAVAPSLLICLVAHPFIYDTLIQALTCTGRYERMPQTVEAWDHGPFTGLNRPAKVIRYLVYR